MTEEWKIIDFTDGKYSASNLGEIKSHVNSKDLIMKQTSNKLKYKNVTLCFDGKRKNYGIHRLVAHCFINNKQQKPCVNHIDNDPSNNHIANLEWCTYSENTLHAEKQGRLNLSHKKCGEATSLVMKNRILKRIDEQNIHNSLKILSLDKIIENENGSRTYMINVLCSCGLKFIDKLSNVEKNVINRCKKCRFEKVKQNNYKNMLQNIKKSSNYNITQIAIYDTNIPLKNVNLSIQCTNCKEELNTKYNNFFRIGRTRKCKNCQKILVNNTVD